jgi:LmbE family N-acetylglucosaminyl deacetylase
VARKLEYPQTWLAPPRGRVAVVAPHPDDESIGCGGVIALHRRQGDEVHLIVVTDGDAGDPERRFPRDGYVERRREECRRAATLLGAAPPVFLGFGDQRLEHAPRLRAELRRALDAVRPDVVYHPAVAELHPDHHVAGAATLLVTGGLKTVVRSFAYEIWAPLVPTHVIDVSPVWDVKHSAVACYASQLAYNDYARAIAGLNAYRAIFLPRASYVEAFAETTVRATGLASRLRRRLARAAGQ